MSELKYVEEKRSERRWEEIEDVGFILREKGFFSVKGNDRKSHF